MKTAHNIGLCAIRATELAIGDSNSIGRQNHRPLLFQIQVRIIVHGRPGDINTEIRTAQSRGR